MPTSVTGPDTAPNLSIAGQSGKLSFTGLSSTNRIKTVRDAADTILELGGSYTPTGTFTNLTLVTPALGIPASGVATNLTGTADGLTAGDVTRNHAVYAGASPPTVDVGMFTIGKTAVNLKAAGTTNIFTVPASRTFLLTGFSGFVTAVTSGGAGTQNMQIKESSAAGTMSQAITTGSHTPVANATSYSFPPDISGAAGRTTCAAGNAVQVVISASHAGSNAVTGTVYAAGFYVS